MPVVRGMARIKPKERARTRVLSDDELRSIWPTLGEVGTYGALVKMPLLTAQRHGELARMTYKEIGADGIGPFPPNDTKQSDRFRSLVEGGTRPHRGSAKIQRLPIRISHAMPKRRTHAQVRARPCLDNAVIASMKKRGKRKTRIEPIPNWALHDLRRTAKTLMVRAGVRPDISERVLGHVIAGVEGTYDRHSYADEKRDALEKLAAMIERIFEPLPSNVASIDGRRAMSQS